MFDTLRTDAAGLQQLLQDGKITSVQIVNEYLAKIDAYNPRLNAFIAVAPRDVLLRAASSLDEERSRGRVRGPLHGIPIVLKVTGAQGQCDPNQAHIRRIGLLRDRHESRHDQHRRRMGVQGGQGQREQRHRAEAHRRRAHHSGKGEHDRRCAMDETPRRPS